MTTHEIKYPDITVQLTGQNGNAFMFLGLCTGAMKQAGLPKEERDAFLAAATAGDYDNLLATAMKWFDVR
jgi:hypothetical protein